MSQAGHSITCARVTQPGFGPSALVSGRVQKLYTVIILELFRTEPSTESPITIVSEDHSVVLRALPEARSHYRNTVN